jgi:hypothetical protein
MAGTWDFLLCDGHGSPLAELTTASGKQIKYKRNHFTEAQLVLSHKDAACGLLLEAAEGGPMPTMRAYRRSTGQVNGTLRFNGYLAPFTEQLEENTLLTATFRSPFGRLYGDGTSGTGRYTRNSLVAEEKDAGLIAASLIWLYGGAGIVGGTDGTFNEAKYEETSFAGLGIGIVEPTVNRTITYPYANVGQAIINLSECVGGFDFDETFVEAGEELARFNTYISQGTTRPAALFQYGPGTLANVTGIEVTSGNPVNVIKLIGPKGLFAEKENAASVARYGRWYYEQQMTDATSQEVLEARCTALLRETPIRTIALKPDLAEPSCPQPFDDFWLGDTVNFYGHRYTFTEELSPRVDEINLTIDENGNETAAIPDPFTATDQSPDLLHTVLKAQA